MKKNTKKQLILCVMACVLTVLWGRASFAADISANIIMQVNQERERAGLPGLNENELLNQAALMKAQDMIDKDYFSHTSPEDVSPWHWLEQAPYQYKYAGENLAMDFSSAESAHRAWMKSETHRENILSDRYMEIGVAVVEGTIENHQTRVAVQFFGTPLSEEQIPFSNTTEEKFDTSVQIVEASVQPWEGTTGDEMLVYAHVSGEPKMVEVHVGSQTQYLEKLGNEKYMNLLSLNDIDLKKDSVVIKAEMDKGQALFYQVPREQYLAYVKGKDTESEEEQQLAQVQSAAQIARSKSFNAQNITLAIFMLACVIMITNVWILEKEEERLLKTCGA